MVTREERGTTPSWAEVIRRAIEQALLELNTGLPARVVEYDPETQSATVQPLLKRAYLDPDEDVVIVRSPQVLTAPVIFPGGNGWAIRWRLKAGDTVHLTFGQRSLDKWKVAVPGQEIDPVESRHHDLSDAVVLPGLRNQSGAMPDPGDDLVIGREDGSNEVRLKLDGTIELGQGAPTRGVARIDDQTVVTTSTDPAFIQWIQTVSTVLNGLLPGSVTNPPTSVTGKVSTASSEVRSK